MCVNQLSLPVTATVSWQLHHCMASKPSDRKVVGVVDEWIRIQVMSLATATMRLT